MTKPLLTMRHVRELFPISGGFFGRTVGYTRAVDGVDATIGKGQTLGLVGESGCGKSTLGRIAVKLLDPTEGFVMFEDIDLSKAEGASWKELRPQMQMVFQDTQSSLDPRMTVESTVAEPLQLVGMKRGSELYETVASLTLRVGLNLDHLNRYPHELSGGERQRVVIARALATNPRFVVLDEPTASLDVSVQAHILNLLKDLQRAFSLTYLFISHDLSVVRFMSDDVGVMYLGKIVEIARTEPIYATPLHPYTRALLAAIPIPDPTLRKQRLVLGGDVPSADSPPPGCRFHPRCPWAAAICSEEEPKLRGIITEHRAACHFAEQFKDQPVYVSSNGG
ncbi:MAG: ABC transporter ATP-binding protein [Thermoleophilia bacterium]|nr:ABC transporter ATP-binding protein [Thermoleophilia bacterium]